MSYRNYLLLFILLLPSFLFRDYTPDNELRYLSIADEALRNNSLFAFYNHGLAYADKPPLYLWLVMLGKWIFGTHSMLYLSLLSVIPAAITLKVMDKWVEPVLNKSNRISLQLMLGSAAYFIGSALVLRMDMLMTMFIVLALYTFYKMYSGKGSKHSSTLFPLYVFLALFSKGPVGLLLPLLAVLVFLIFEGKIKTFSKYWGLKAWSILLLACALWFSLVYWEGGKEYLNNLLFKQTVNRAIDAFHHKRPFYYYFVSIWYILAPWSIFIITIIIAAISKRNIITALERLFLTIAAVTMLMLSMFSSKVDVYMLPALPFFAALALLIMQKNNYPFARWLLAVPIAIITLASIAGLVLIGNPKFDIPSHPLIYAAISVLLVAGIGSLFQLFKKQSINQTINTFALGLLLTVFLASFALPSLNDKIGYAAICKAGEQLSEKSTDKHYYRYNVRRGENMDVYLNQSPTELTDADIEQNKIGKGVLFYRTKDLQKNVFLKKAVEGKPSITKGAYTAVLF